MAMTYEDYVKENGSTCPFCLSKNVEATLPLFSQADFIIAIKVMCGDCYKRWQEIYTFSYYSEITP